MRWIAKILLFFVLLSLVALSLVATVPLRFALDNLPLPPLPVQINHVQGTVVDGRARLTMKNLALPPPIAAQLETLTIAWRWCPSFDTGLSAVCLETHTELVHGTFAVAVSPVAAELHNVELQANLQQLPIPIANQSLNTSGRLQLSLLNIAVPYRSRLPSQVHGNVILEGLIVGIFNLGDFNIDLSSDENATLSAAVTGSGELVDVQGIATLNQDYQYRYSVDIESGNTLVRNFLASRGQDNGRGGYRLAKTGTLPSG